MKTLLLLFFTTTMALADVAKLINLELYDNQNPAIITDIEDELNHVIVDLALNYSQEKNNSIKSEAVERSLIGIKVFKRFDDWVFYLNVLQTATGEKSDNNSTSADEDSELSHAEISLASTFFDDYDIGLSFAYDLEDSNITTRTHQLGLRYLKEDIALGLVAGTKAKRSSTLAENYQNFYSLGLALGETADTLIDLSATLRPKSTSDATASLLEHVQAKTYEATAQIQSSEAFNRTGFRFDYQKLFARSSAEKDSHIRKFRFHTGVKVEREENSYSVFYISYEKTRQGDLVNNDYKMGISLRGFYE